MRRVPVSAKRSVRQDHLRPDVIDHSSEHVNHIALFPCIAPFIRISDIALVEANHVVNAKRCAGERKFASPDFRERLCGRFPD